MQTLPDAAINVRADAPSAIRPDLATGMHVGGPATVPATTVVLLWGDDPAPTPADPLGGDLFALGRASGLAGEDHHGLTSPPRWYEGYLAGAAERDARDRDALPDPTPSDDSWLAEQRGTFDSPSSPQEPRLPFAEWIGSQASCYRFQGTEAALWLAAKLDGLAAEARSLRAPSPADFDGRREVLEDVATAEPLRPSDPAAWHESEVLLARQGSGHGFGRDLDADAAVSAALDRHERGLLA